MATNSNKKSKYNRIRMTIKLNPEDTNEIFSKNGQGSLEVDDEFWNLFSGIVECINVDKCADIANF